MKRLIALLICIVTLFSFVSCSDGLTKYSSDKGLSIRLPEGFTEVSMAGATYALSGEHGYFIAMRDDFDGMYSKYEFPSTASLFDYAQFIIAGNEIETQIAVRGKDDLYFTYTSAAEGQEEYFYYATVRKGSDAFWLCQFACKSSLKELNSPLFDEWSYNITVD